MTTVSPHGPASDVPVLVVGEALIDVVLRADGSVVEHVGGSPANVAVGLSRLGHPVSLATHLGDDEHGRMIAEHVSRERVALVGAPTAARTPTATATLDASGAATYEFDLAWELATGVQLDAVGHLHTGSIGATMEPGASAVLTTAQQARSRATLSYDPNVRPTLMGAAHDVRAKVEQLIGLADVVKASDEDVAWLYAGAPVAEVLRLWGRLGPSVVVVTRGAAGAVVGLPGTGEVASVAAPSARVVDTVGAGDSFMAGLLSGLLDAGLLGPVDGDGPDAGGARQRLRGSALPDVRPAVQRALAAAAVTVSRAGANPPTRAELGGPSAPGWPAVEE